jgi:putative transposase
MSISKKQSCIDPHHRDLSVQRQCDLIELPRSSYYRQSTSNVETEVNLALMALIDAEYTRHPFYGTRKMRDYLRRQGHKVNRKRVQRLMRKMGLQSIAPKPKTSKPHPGHKIYPYLLRDLKIICPDQVWCSDITYIPLPGGVVYLTAVMDWRSRFVLSWEVSVTMDSSFCVSALESAFRRYGRPEIFNTDQGSQYTSSEFTSAVLDHDVLISMDGKGRYIDNILIERLWRSVKYEEVYVKEYSSVGELIKSLRDYFEFYNHERPHAGLGGKTPAEIYWGCSELQMAA